MVCLFNHHTTPHHTTPHHTTNTKRHIRWRVQIGETFWVAFGVSTERVNFQNDSRGIFVGYTSPGGIYTLAKDDTTRLVFPAHCVVEITLNCKKRLLYFEVVDHPELQFDPLDLLKNEGLTFYPWGDVYNANGVIRFVD